MAEGRDLMSRFVRTPEAGRLLGLSARTLEKHRTCGTGPIYRKLGGRVVYSLADLRAWADTDVRISTSQTAKPHPSPASEAELRRGI